jgi:LysM repeat protein
VKIGLFYRLFSRKLFFLCLIANLLFLPIVTNAGLGSLFSSISNQDLAATSETGKESIPLNNYNSQNINLLKATLNPNANSSKGGGGITIVDGVALLPDNKPISEDDDAYHNGEISLYVVRRGDTIYDIARMFGVSVNTIIWGNDLKSSIIYENQTLIILPVSGVRHLVKEGDTLEGIAKLYKGNLEEIIKFNNLSADQKLAVGETIIIPDGEITAPPATAKHLIKGGGAFFDGYYGRPLLAYRKTQGLHGYNGVDLAAPYGTPIYAAAAGEVIISRDFGWNGGYGRYIVISHSNNTQTLYAHLSDIVVYQGARVYKGQLIGYVGSSGKSTGPHLHFEIRGAANPF